MSISLNTFIMQKILKHEYDNEILFKSINNKFINHIQVVSKEFYDEKRNYSIYLEIIYKCVTDNKFKIKDFKIKNSLNNKIIFHSLWAGHGSQFGSNFRKLVLFYDPIIYEQYKLTIN